MSALARLKALRSGEKVGGFTRNAHSKPSKPPFEGFEGRHREKTPDICAEKSAAVEPELTRQLDTDGLAHWLRDEGLCLVLRGGRLIYTGKDGRGIGEPSAKLQAHVEAHRAAVVALLTPGGG